MKKKLSGPGRPKNEIKTVAIGCRISENAAWILDKVEGRKIGQFISKLIEDSELNKQTNDTTTMQRPDSPTVRL